MKDMMLQVPAEVIDATRLPFSEIEAEYRKELAVALYQRGVLASGKASILAQMTRLEFEEILGKRQIIRHYLDSDLKEDLQYAHSHL